MQILNQFLIIILTSLAIFKLGGIFAKSSSILGDYFRLSKSVKGATFDAIASSFPEFLVALFSVIFFQKFEVGVGTIAGSALFNLLVIPGICVLVSPVVFKVSREVIMRDTLFYIISVFALLVLVLYFKSWGIGVSLGLLAIYGFYLEKIFKHSKKNREKIQPKSPKIKLRRELFIAISTMLAIGVATYFLTESSIHLSEILNVSPVIIAFTVIAAATSLPDAVISIINAKKGDIDDATANVFGSNIFDITICMGVPLFIYYFLKGDLIINFDYLEIIVGLLGATIIVLYFFAEDHILRKKQGMFLLFMYLFFVGYTIYLS